MHFSYKNIYYLAILIPSIEVGARRMYDIGKRGSFLLIHINNIVPAVTDDQIGDNKYGVDPKAVVV